MIWVDLEKNYTIKQLNIYFLKYGVTTMSVLRDARDLGYGPDHFMITGENFPSEWQEDQNYANDYDDMDIPQYEPEIEEHLNTLDTREGWIKRKHFVENEEPIGVIKGVGHYHSDQTTPYSELTENIVKSIEEQLDKLQEYLMANKSTDLTQLNAEYEKCKQSIIKEIDATYATISRDIPF